MNLKNPFPPMVDGPGWLSSSPHRRENPPMLTIATEQKGDVVVMTLEGRIDADFAKSFETACLERIDQGDRQLVMDFKGVNFISSAGLRVFLLIAKQLQPTGRRIKLAALNPALMDVFEISGFSKLFTIVPHVEDAL